jgi:hypothetical protein
MRKIAIALLACGMIGGSLWFSGCNTPNEQRENRGITSSPTVSPTPYTTTTPGGSPTIAPTISPSPATSPGRRTSPSPTPTRRE